MDLVAEGGSSLGQRAAPAGASTKYSAVANVPACRTRKSDPCGTGPVRLQNMPGNPARKTGEMPI